MADVLIAPEDLDDHLERHRVELTGYCYRMLGSSFEADDAVQDTMVRAWRAYDGFEGRSSLRSWLYRIATNVCLDHLNGRNRRARPMDLGPASPFERAELGPVHPEETWVEPVADHRVLPSSGDDPAELVASKESIRLAFVAALQHLPPRQRAVLILREVLRLSAAEVADLLDTTVASVNSALQRARATLDRRAVSALPPAPPLEAAQADLVARYVDAFERYDIEALKALLHAEATLSMPPFALWIQGPDDIAAWMLGPGAECAGSRMVPVAANGSPAWGQYRPSGPGGRHEPWALQVLEFDGDRITGINAFLEVGTWFPRFDLPDTP